MIQLVTNDNNENQLFMEEKGDFIDMNHALQGSDNISFHDGDNAWKDFDEVNGTFILTQLIFILITRQRFNGTRKEIICCQ
jgi:hypothetical protein